MNCDDANCEVLLRCTTDALDVMELQKLLVSTQQISIDLNIEYAIKWVWFGCCTRYWLGDIYFIEN